MTKILDPRKQSDWQKRLARFRSSDKTVTQFCQHEQVTPSTFYYWSRRLRQEGSTAKARRRRRGDESDRHLEPVAKTRKQPTVDSVPSVPMVHFTWNEDLHVSIPAHCMDAIRCVLEWSREGVSETPKSSGQDSVFHQVLIDAR